MDIEKLNQILEGDTEDERPAPSKKEEPAIKLSMNDLKQLLSNNTQPQEEATKKPKKKISKAKQDALKRAREARAKKARERKQQEPYHQQSMPQQSIPQQQEPYQQAIPQQQQQGMPANVEDYIENEVKRRCMEFIQQNYGMLQQQPQMNAPQIEDASQLRQQQQQEPLGSCSNSANLYRPSSGLTKQQAQQNIVEPPQHQPIDPMSLFKMTESSKLPKDKKLKEEEDKFESIYEKRLREEKEMEQQKAKSVMSMFKF